jgi:hypothetical protein
VCRCLIGVGEAVSTIIPRTAVASGCSQSINVRCAKNPGTRGKARRVCGGGGGGGKHLLGERVAAATPVSKHSESSSRAGEFDRYVVTSSSSARGRTLLPRPFCSTHVSAINFKSRFPLGRSNSGLSILCDVAFHLRLESSVHFYGQATHLSRGAFRLKPCVCRISVGFLLCTVRLSCNYSARSDRYIL